MPVIAYVTATTLDGYLATGEHSLDWLFAVEGGDDALAETAEFVDGVGVLVEGSSTYEWVVEHERLVEEPTKWQALYADRPTFVFTSRADIVRVPGADVRFVAGAVADHIEAIKEAAGDRDIWVVGGGDLAAQFAAIGLLDEIRVSVAPVLLGGGAPLFTGELLADRLRLVDVHQVGQFAQLRYLLESDG